LPRIGSKKNKKSIESPSDHSQEGVLYMVATPIGNLGDMTLRAIETLQQCDRILCEDTRQTQKLLQHLQIKKKLERFDEHMIEKKSEQAIQWLQAGENLAFLTDAGTPGICDPGSALVAQALNSGVSVVPVPGASALTAILSVSGFRDPCFAFRGFFPRTDAEKMKELHFVSHILRHASPFLFVWFESPHRILKTFQWLGKHLPGETEVVVAKELTKHYEKIFKGNLAQINTVFENIFKDASPKGEWVFLIKGVNASQRKLPEAEGLQNEQGQLNELLQDLIDAGLSVKKSTEIVVRTLNVPKKQVYTLALELIKKKRIFQS